MASFKAKFPVLQELFAKNHRGARVKTKLDGNPVYRNRNLHTRAFILHNILPGPYVGLSTEWVKLESMIRVVKPLPWSGSIHDIPASPLSDNNSNQHALIDSSKDHLQRKYFTRPV